MTKLIKIAFLVFILVISASDLFAENEQWTFCDAGGPLPRTRSGHSAIHDLAGNRMIIFGGMSDVYGYELGDMWALDDSAFAWTELETTNDGPNGLRDHAAIYNPNDNTMVLFAGVYNSGQITNDVWILHLENLTWELVIQDSEVWPIPRFNVYGIHCEQANEMIIFAGRDLGDRLNDMWAFDLGTHNWRQIPYSNPWPSNREGPPMVLTGPNTFAIFGGYDPQFSHYNDIWTFDLNSGQWTEYFPSYPMPGGRRRSSITYDKANDRILIYGGTGSYSGFGYGDLWEFNMSTTSFTELSPTGDIPPPRGYHTGMSDFGCVSPNGFGGYKVVVFAGADYSANDIYNDTYFLDWDGIVAVDEEAPVPSDFVTLNSYPNPFNAATTLDFTLAEPLAVELEIYNISGQLIEKLYQGYLPAGQHTFRWDANNCSSGVYFSKLIAGDTQVVNRLVLLK
ncbi:MAG: T9SS type A sorting domain-containing protein [candidate division Zixibacteria bacterium]|nr:T9SS type A sorting domain-containing protein [candidate division Zixibacteria bacterium]